jgi:hypothetical protein
VLVLKRQQGRPQKARRRILPASPRADPDHRVTRDLRGAATAPEKGGLRDRRRPPCLTGESPPHARHGRSGPGEPPREAVPDQAPVNMGRPGAGRTHH